MKPETRTCRDARGRETLPLSACEHCKKEFKKLRKAQVFCSRNCKRRAAGVKPRNLRNKNDVSVRRASTSKAAIPIRECPTCHENFQPTRVTKRFCSNLCCVKWNQTKHTITAANLPAVDSTVTARLLADGFYLGGLREEIERIRKKSGIVSLLETQLRIAVFENPIWPTGKIGRIALALALLKNNALLDARWRHPHEPRPGPRKPSGVGIRAHGAPGRRF